MTDDLAKRLRTDAESYRQSIAAPTSHDMFTLAYQWQDKKHRHVWDLCSRLETAADRIEKLEAALLGIKIYGNDTMSGPEDGGEDNRNWYRGAVIVMKNRAREALEGKDD